MLVFASGSSLGMIGGGYYESDAFWKAREAITNRRPQLVHYKLSNDFAQETGLICGGQMDVYIEPIDRSSNDQLRRRTRHKQLIGSTVALTFWCPRARFNPAFQAVSFSLRLGSRGG